jgi:hypothetical protein
VITPGLKLSEGFEGDAPSFCIQVFQQLWVAETLIFLLQFSGVRVEFLIKKLINSAQNKAAHTVGVT